MSDHVHQSGAQPALTAATAHLQELLSALDSINSKAMFVIGLSIASNSLFVAVIASLGQPWWSAAAPTIQALVVVTLGLWVLRTGPVSQFPAPTDLLRLRGEGLNDDEVAWAVVDALAESSEAASIGLRWNFRWVFVLGLLTVAQLVTTTVIGLVLIL